MKLAIGDELQTLFHPIVYVTKQAAEETRKEFEPMKKTLTNIDGALKRVDARPQQIKMLIIPLVMGNKVVLVDGNRKTLTVDDIEYELTPGLQALVIQKHPQP